MKNKTRAIALSVSFCIILSLLTQVFLPIVSFADDSIIYIDSAEDLIELSKNCSYDAWSVNKEVVLTADISLAGIDFKPIASFSGSFDGGGHKISGLNVTGAYSPAGLFSTLEKEALVRNLFVEGAVSPGGDKGYAGGIVGDNNGRIEDCYFTGTVIGKSDIGGIAGINRASGSISGCTVSGEIIGENRTGGIAGSNEGLISSCTNDSKVNTIGVTPAISLDEINISLTLDITKLYSLNNSTMTDTGGIAGYSTGIVMSCLNKGAVGYPHIGYNAGGIVGRNSGHLASNENSGEINGRKDVGGIVGQMEPHISYNLSEDLLASLKAELDNLNTIVNDTLGSAGEGVPGVSTRLDTILENLDAATLMLQTIINDTTDYGNGVVGEINRFSEIIGEVISQLDGVMDQVPELSGTLESCFADLESMLEDLESFSSVSAGLISDISSAATNISLAFDSISIGISDINTGLAMLQAALTVSDPTSAEEALDIIASGISCFINSADRLTSSLEEIMKVLDDTAWMDGAIDHMAEAARIIEKMSVAMSEIYDATTELKESITLDWSKIEEASDELVIAIGHITDMTVSLAEAMECMDSGITGITEGLEMLYGAVTVKDAEAIDGAIEKIESGFESFIAGSVKSGEALSELASILENINDSNSLNILGDVASAIGDLAESGMEMTSAMSETWDGIEILLNSIDIDLDAVGEGGAIIIAGMGDITDSIAKMKSAVQSLSDGMGALEKAITALDQAINVDDEERASAALDSAYSALGDIIDSTAELSTLFSDITVTLAEAKVWGDSMVDAFAATASALSDMSGAIVVIQNGVDSLRSLVSLDSSSAEEGLNLIKNGIEAMSDSAYYLGLSFADISSALDKVNSGSEHLDAALSNLKSFMGGMKNAMGIVETISGEAKMLIGYLSGIDPITLPTLPDSIMANANQLFIHISAIENELKYLNTDITGLGSDLIAQLGKINDSFNSLSANIVDMIYGLNNGGIIDNNVSENEIDAVTHGKVFGCVNNGGVFGDINVGGIAGAMGLEYTLDPEDDLTSELSVTQKKQYKLKAVIHACINNGSVTSKRDCAGGIVGKMDLGLVYGCESYCDVESQTGNYVGGIAGITSGLISQCYAKCTLAGGKYVGGIVGSGVSESFSGDSSMVRSSYSMIKITRFTQYAGAISGINNGEYGENLFVSDDLAGIDRVSYAGKAEPISYEDLIKRRSIPDGFYLFSLEFYADGKLLHSTEFAYGASFDQTVFPEIPDKEGHYGYWDTTDLSNLRFDTSVSVVYVPYVTALGSENKREDGKEIFFVQGMFTKEDSISVTEGCDTSDLSIDKKLFYNDSLVESWTLTIPTDKLDNNGIHYLAMWKSCRIFVKAGGEWTEVEAEKFGSYLTFEVSGETVDIAVFSHSLNIVLIVILCVAFLVILAGVIITIILVKKKKTKKNNEEMPNKPKKEKAPKKSKAEDKQ